MAWLPGVTTACGFIHFMAVINLLTRGLGGPADYLIAAVRAAMGEDGGGPGASGTQHQAGGGGRVYAQSRPGLSFQPLRSYTRVARVHAVGPSSPSGM